MTYDVLMGTLNPTHSLTHSLCPAVYVIQQSLLRPLFDTATVHCWTGHWILQRIHGHRTVQWQS